MSIYTDEIFGPVLSVVRVDCYDEGLDLINTNPYGNGTAIFTNDGGAARRFQNEVQVGMIGINVPGPGPGRLLLASAAGRPPCSATPTPTAPRASTSTPAARSSPPAGSTPATAASTSASRRTTDVPTHETAAHRGTSSSTPPTDGPVRHVGIALQRRRT